MVMSRIAFDLVGQKLGVEAALPSLVEVVLLPSLGVGVVAF